MSSHLDLKEQLDHWARHHPGYLEKRVAFVNFLGYLVLGGLIFIGIGIPIIVCTLVLTSDNPFIALFQLFIHGGFFIPLASWQIFMALQMEHVQPDGLELEELHHPELWEMVRKVASNIDSPVPNKILLVHEFNAAAHYRPGFGERESTNTLLLGLPLMDTLEPDEFRAVVAHELGHFAGEDGRKLLAAHRQKLAWRRLQENCRINVSFSGWIRAIVHDFAPWHDAHVSALQRYRERLADDFAVMAAGKEPTARALSKIAWNAERLELDFWSGIDERAWHGDSQPDSIYSEVVEFVRSPCSSQRHRELWDRVHTLQASPSDTHPKLHSRVEAFESEVDEAKSCIGPASGKSATDVLLRTPTDLRQEMSIQWKQSLESRWSERTTAREALLSKKAQIEASSSATLSPKVKLECAEIVLRTEGAQAARSFVESLASEIFADNQIRIFYGRLLATMNDPLAESVLEEALSQDPKRSEELLSLLIEFASRRGAVAKSEEFKLRLVGFRNQEEEKRTLIAESGGSVRFDTPELDPDARHRLREVVLGHEWVDNAWLVVNHDGDSSIPSGVYLVYVQLGTPQIGSLPPSRQHEILMEIGNAIFESRCLEREFIVMTLPSGRSKKEEILEITGIRNACLS